MSGPDWAGDSGLHACGASSPDPNPQESRSHHAGGRRDLPPLWRPTCVSARLCPLETRHKPPAFPGAEQTCSVRRGSHRACSPRLTLTRLPGPGCLRASLGGRMLRAGALAKGSSRLWQRHRRGPSPGWDWPGSSISPAQRLPSPRLPSPGTAAAVGLGPEAASPRRAGGRAGAAFIYVMLGEKGELATGSPANRISGKWKAGARSAWNCPDFQLETSHGD